MRAELAMEQALRYAEELRELHAAERANRRAAEEALARLADSYATTVRALAAALELRDDMTGNHAERVTRLALGLARRVVPRLADDPQLEYGFLLHDVGKIGVADAILLKPGPLDEDERRAIELHPLHGQRLVAQIPYLNGLARQVVLSHHERWDGAGYPNGLSEEEIPLAARIFALADTFDAMTTDRPYRRALPVEDAVREIEQQAGRQFDPELAPEFISLLPELRTAA
ncbi:MAG: HD-GYP domain-containing protein [Gaiellaceae bacterium]